MRGLKDKNVLVTGGASGVGQATATRFLEEECSVCVLDRSAEARARVSDEPKPEEIAALFAYLASDDAAYATGQVYVMDGGDTAGSLYSQ